MNHTTMKGTYELYPLISHRLYVAAVGQPGSAQTKTMRNPNGLHRDGSRHPHPPLNSSHPKNRCRRLASGHCATPRRRTNVNYLMGAANLKIPCDSMSRCSPYRCRTRACPSDLHRFAAGATRRSVRSSKGRALRRHDFLDDILKKGVAAAMVGA